MPGLAPYLPQVLDIRSNQLSGAIPEQLALITALYELDLSNNAFTSLPKAFANMTWLINSGTMGDGGGLLIQSNNLAGELPSEFGTWGSTLTDVSAVAVAVAVAIPSG